MCKHALSSHPIPPRPTAGTSEPLKVASALTFAPLQLPAPEQQQGSTCGAEGACGDAQCTDAVCDGGSTGQQQQKQPKGEHCELAQGKETCTVGCCDGPTLMSVARLDTCVTVVDASTLRADLKSIEEMADRCGALAGAWQWAGSRDCSYTLKEPKHRPQTLVCAPT